MTHHTYCIHCGEVLRSEPEKEKGFWFLRCLSCGAHNILAEPPLPASPAPETEEVLIGYTDAPA